MIGTLACLGLVTAVVVSMYVAVFHNFDAKYGGKKS